MEKYFMLGWRSALSLSLSLSTHSFLPLLAFIFPHSYPPLHFYSISYLGFDFQPICSLSLYLSLTIPPFVLNLSTLSLINSLTDAFLLNRFSIWLCHSFFVLSSFSGFKTGRSNLIQLMPDPRDLEPSRSGSSRRRRRWRRRRPSIKSCQ